MSRADELLPIPQRGEPVVYPGKGLTDAHRSLLDIEERWASGNPDVRVIVYRRKDVSGPQPLLLNLHGGAFCLFRADSFAGQAADLAVEHGCTAVAVDYRLAPEHPFPAAPDDCYTALRWAVAELDIDPTRVVVVGGSAGGALAAALTLMARDRGGPHIAFQVLTVPMLDDRLETPSMRAFGAGHPGFNASEVEGSWLHYLGAEADRSSTSPYAAPMRASTLAGLPPAFIKVNGLDALRDEGIAYAQRLMADGVPVELYVVPGAHHGGTPLDERAAAQGARVEHEAIAAAVGG